MEKFESNQNDKDNSPEIESIYEEEQESKESRLSPEEEIEKIVNKIKALQQEASELVESNESTLGSLNNIRSKLGLMPNEDYPPSTHSDTERLEKIRKEVEALIIQKEHIEKNIDDSIPESLDNPKDENITIKEEKEDELTVQDINVGDEVYYRGRKWRVFNVGARPSISEETDADFNYRMMSQEKDPNNEPRKKVKNYGGLTLVGTDGAYRDFRGGPTFKDVVKITPQNKAKIEKMIRDSEL